MAVKKEAPKKAAAKAAPEEGRPQEGRPQEEVSDRSPRSRPASGLTQADRPISCRSVSSKYVFEEYTTMAVKKPEAEEVRREVRAQEVRAQEGRRRRRSDRTDAEASPAFVAVSAVNGFRAPVNDAQPEVLATVDQLRGVGSSRRQGPGSPAPYPTDQRGKDLGVFRFVPTGVGDKDLPISGRSLLQPTSQWCGPQCRAPRDQSPSRDLMISPVRRAASFPQFGLIVSGSTKSSSSP